MHLYVINNWLLFKNLIQWVNPTINRVRQDKWDIVIVEEQFMSSTVSNLAKIYETGNYEWLSDSCLWIIPSLSLPGKKNPQAVKMFTVSYTKQICGSQHWNHLSKNMVNPYLMKLYNYWIELKTLNIRLFDGKISHYKQFFLLWQR